MGHHASARLLYGYDLHDRRGEWAFAQFEPADESNGWVSRFTMPWFVEEFGDGVADIDRLDDGMADPSEVLQERLNSQAVDGVGISDPFDGEQVALVVNPDVGTPEEGMYPVDLAALLARAESEDWDARLETAREALGITFTDPAAKPGWLLVSTYDR